MPEKMIAAMIAAIAALVLGSTVMASAQTAPYRQGPPGYSQSVAPNFGAYRYDPYAGTYWDGVAPYSSYDQPDPYAGTPWDGVAPY